MWWSCAWTLGIVDISSTAVAGQVSDDSGETGRTLIFKLRDLSRTKLEYSLVGGITGINPASRNNPTAWECWNTLARSALPT